MTIIDFSEQTILFTTSSKIYFVYISFEELSCSFRFTIIIFVIFVC